MTGPLLAIPTIDEIRVELCAAAFGSPLISNIYRGLVAEIIVGAALGSEWQLCSGDWRGFRTSHRVTAGSEAIRGATDVDW